jgi:hypothetical protein
VALTLTRWIAVFVAGALAIAAANFTPKKTKEVSDPRRQRYSDLKEREQRAGQAAVDAAMKLRAIQVRDSVAEAIARAPKSDASRYIISTGLPASAFNTARVLGARADLVRPKGVSNPIDIAIVFDTISIVRGRQVYRGMIGMSHSFPVASGGRCLAVGRIERDGSWYHENYWSNNMTSVETASHLLGPCAFYEAYGTPGPAIDRWLAGGAWKFGSSPSLDARYDSWDDGADHWWTPVWGRSAGWPLRRYSTPLGYRCTAGEADACKRAVLDPNSDPNARTKVRVGADRVLQREFDRNEYGVTMGPYEPTFLAEMAASLGPEKFRQFWTSDKPVEEAFRAATSQDIGNWTVNWAKSVYGSPRLGPGMSTTSYAWSVILIVVGLAGATVAGRRRQMA